MTASEDLQVRSFGPGDREGFADLVASVLQEFGMKVDPVLEADLDDPPTHYDAIWIAAAGDAVVGCAAVRGLGDGSAELKRMYLRPTYRGRGPGRALLEKAIGWASDQGCESIVLDTSTTMTDAQRLYESAGFARTGERTEKGADDSRCEILYSLRVSAWSPRRRR